MNSAMQTIAVRVSDVRAEARDVMTFELRAIGGGELPPFEPGAHLDVHLPNGSVRQYSLTNDSRERDRYVIGVGRAVASRGGSEFLHTTVRAGLQLNISAPRNNFALDQDADSYLFIAGGIGITPIMAMVRWCAVNRKPWRLIYAARSRQRAAFYEEFCSLGAERVHFHFDDECGQILDVAEAIATRTEDAHIHCCGPTPLMDAVKSLTAHLPPDTVRFEWFTAPVSDQPEPSDGFSLRLERSGRELTVPANKSILEVLEEHGFDVPFSCREGLCGTCQTHVCGGEIDHRDYVLSDEERDSGKVMMVCVSRAKSPQLVLDI